MTNFKGTKGKWLKYRKTDQHNVEEIRTIEGKSVCLIANNDESEYNAKLIAHAPEMLEILEKCKEYFLLKTDLKNEERADAIADLIERATK